MINSGGSPFQNAASQQNTDMTKSWDTFSKTNRDVDDQNSADTVKTENEVKDPLKKHIIVDEDVAKESLRGHDTLSEYKAP